MKDEKKYPNLNTPNAINNRFSGERAVEAGRKGNRKRSENVQIKKLLINLLQDKATSSIASQVLEEAGMEKDTKKKTRNKEVLAHSILLQALGGSYKMTQLLLKVIGEMPTDNSMFNSESQKQDLEMLVNAIKGVKDEEETTESDDKRD